MIYGSVCSGIEAATAAWHTLGWKPAFFSEIEKFPRAVLAHHYPDVPLHGDFTTIKGNEYGAIDLLCGGTPCQSFSVAGLRKGLTDERGNLTLEFIRLAERTKPRWLVWENVPGVLSSNGGRDFGSFLGGLGECGYGFSYRVLDAQYFGVPQRRRRVVLVGYLGDWRPAAAVLFERESLRGDITPRREKREEVTEIAGTLAANGGGVTRPAGNANELDFCVVSTFDRQSSGEYGTAPVASTVSARDYKSPSDLISYGIPGNWINRAPENGGNAVEPMHDVSPCLTGADRHGVVSVFDPNQITSKTNRSVPTPELCHTLPATPNSPVAFGVGEQPDLAHCLRSGASKADKHESTTYIAEPSMQVRRLTPRECERLQGFPDDYTAIPGAADGNRYKALGNSWAVPKFRWIGERIQMVEKMIGENK